MRTITATQLHQETKTVLGEIVHGQFLEITRNGKVIASLVPANGGKLHNWDKIMVEVWKA